MRRPVIVALGACLGACTLLTDLDGFTSAPDAGGSGAGTSGQTQPDARVTDASDASLEAAPVACNIPTDSDPKNCGACGKDCLGGKCTAGKCEATVLASNLSSPLGVAISRGKLYVGQKGGLTEFDLDGRNMKLVVKDNHAKYVWGNDTDVLFSGANANILRWSHTEDGKTTQLVGASDVSGVALSPTHLIYTRYTDEASGGGIYRQTYPTPGDAPEKLKGWNHAECVTWADGKTYFAGDGEDVAMLLRDDGTTDKLSGGGGTTGIFVLGDDAFITRQGSGELLHVSIATKESKTLVRNLGGPSGVVATANAIYWVEVNSGRLGALVR